MSYLGLRTWNPPMVKREVTTYDRGEPAVSYRLNRSSLRNNRSKFKTAWKITDRCRAIYRTYSNSIKEEKGKKEKRRTSTCNRLDLQTLGSQPNTPKNLPDPITCPRWLPLGVSTAKIARIDLEWLGTSCEWTGPTLNKWRRWFNGNSKPDHVQRQRAKGRGQRVQTKPTFCGDGDRPLLLLPRGPLKAVPLSWASSFISTNKE